MEPTGSAVNQALVEAGFRRSGPPGGGDGLAWANGAKRVDISHLPGRLIVVEGTDGAGRSTHIALLREWLENRGFGVAFSAMTRSRLAGEGLRRAKEGHTLDTRTMDLFYATDFADRLENQILPALRAGFVVLTDRYIYSLMARSIVRGVDPAWVADVYRFAPAPHAVLYLQIDVEHLAPRVLTTGGFDYWESGMDFQEESDLFQSFVRYQSRLITVFDQIATREGFRIIDANRGVPEVFADLKQGCIEVVRRMQGWEEEAGTGGRARGAAV
ncbi:MAG: dTMP kinase [Phycisphaerales bacterium]|nr:dTMP kinase [Phycisphaerales bacterium]